MFFPRPQRLTACIALLLAMLVGSAHALTVAPDNSNLQYVGRFTNNKMFEWTGSSIRCRFENSPTIKAKLITSSKMITFQVIVDDKPTKVIYAVKDQPDYVVAENLTPGEHTVELFQRTEAYFGITQFGGLELADGAKLLPLPVAKRRLMVLGDSITCAYGSEAPNRNTGNTAENENGYMSYAAIAARELDADIMMICWSGRGIYRNRGINDKPGEETIPAMFDRILPRSKKADWKTSSYVPDVVVINLGTNDLYRGKEKQKPALTEENYLGAYRQMIARLRSAYPKVQIVACIGPMALAPITNWLPELEK